MARFVAASAACLLLSASATAQIIAPAPSSPLIVIPPPPPTSDLAILKAGRTLVIQTLAPLSSLTNKPGDRVAIELASPIVEDGRVVVPAGLKGEGEVIHAAKARWGGKPGEMIVNARFLDCGTARLPIGRLKWSSAGRDKMTDAMVASMVFTPAMFLVSGGNVEIPAGSHGDARLASDVIVRRGEPVHCSLVTPAASPVATANPTPVSIEEKKP